MSRLVCSSALRRTLFRAPHISSPSMRRELLDTIRHPSTARASRTINFQGRRSLSDLPPGTTITGKNPADVLRGKLTDVEGGKLSEEEEVEPGHLHLAERAKNLVASNTRFQLATYSRVPDTPENQDALFTDPRSPIKGTIHDHTGRLVVFLSSEKNSDRKHAENARSISFASVSTGHIDPPPLIPVFTRVGLLPPVVRILGDLEAAPENYTEELRKLMNISPEDQGDLFWMNPAGVFFVDLQGNRRDIKMRDFQAADKDPLCGLRQEIIHNMNTENIDWLPRFVANYKGVPLNEGFFYDVDRMGFSIFGWQKDTENVWAEYRFEFTEKVEDKESFFQNIEMLKTGILEAKTKY